MEPPRSDSIHAQIAIRAYQRWENRGRPIGSPEEDWVNAEEDLGVLLDEQRLPSHRYQWKLRRAEVPKRDTPESGRPFRNPVS